MGTLRQAMKNVPARQGGWKGRNKSLWGALRVTFRPMIAPLVVSQVPLRISCYSEVFFWPAVICTTCASFFLSAGTLKKKAPRRCRQDPIFCCHLRLPIDCEKANNTLWTRQAFGYLNLSWSCCLQRDPSANVWGLCVCVCVPFSMTPENVSDSPS